MFNSIFEESNYKLLPESKSLEVERIIETYGDALVLSLRVRNNTNKAVKINSFVVAEFVLPEERKIKSILENNWLQCSNISYEDINDYTLKNREFLQRDQNPFSFKSEYGYVEKSIISEWFTSINLLGNNLFVGAVTTKNQFSQIFIKKEEKGTLIRVTCQNDGLKLNPGEVLKSEKIFFRLGSEPTNKEKFAEALAHYMKIKSIEDPINAFCCSYYWNGNKINDAIINSELDAIEALPKKLKINYIQLDAGYTKYFGDWLNYKERFPEGFENIVKRIKSLGFEAGIWLSPFSINPGTKLHDHHKSWVLKGEHKKHFEGRWTSPFDNVSNITDLEVLDPTKIEVKEYLKSVLLHFKSLGFKLFKIDFLYPVCLSSNYSKKVTRAQALREGLEFIREVLGSDCKILTGITQLSSVVGIADYVRTGIDSFNPFVNKIPIVDNIINEYMFESNLNETKLRSFLNGVVWRADPDVLVFSDNTGIKETMINKQKNFIKQNHMSRWIGDSIFSMDMRHKKALLRFFDV